MAKTARRTTAEQWQSRVDRWSASGLTAEQFAAREGVSPHSLSWWKWQLRKRGRNAAARSPEICFVALQEAPEAVAAAEPFEVLLATGHRVRVPARFDTAALARLVEALGGGRQ
jgi:transposase-like protein